eukprot:TRINITY_DN13142_c0_g1_i1.p1 TRINITY_DN13142_c0_g1~~TRINITY_DN13142_c0_g1_i1.p1  ORF type:complete len:224 (+),score=70.68 TRINITY_DN13142_c0_g1_i1:50-673(+)
MAERLRQRVLEDGVSVGAGLVRLTSFFNHQVDAKMMQACGQELASVFRDAKVTKVLTAPTSGLLAAYPVAIELGVDFVYTRDGVMPKTWAGEEHAAVEICSRTKQKSSTHYVLKAAITAEDRVLVVDDVLSTGGTAAALVQLAQAAGAEVVGVAALLEKSFEQGRGAVDHALPGVKVATLVDIPRLADPLTSDDVVCVDNTLAAALP